MAIAERISSVWLKKFIVKQERIIEKKTHVNRDSIIK